MGRNSRERRGRGEVLRIVILSHDSQTRKQFFFSFLLFGRTKWKTGFGLTRDENRVGSRIFFKDWRSLKQNQQIEVNDKYES